MAWHGPLISQLAVRALLNRPRRDSARVKEFDRAELVRRARAAGYRPQTRPRTHQLAAWLLCTRYPAYGIFLDPGLGKTKLAYDLIAYRKQRGELRKALVLVPNTALIQGWLDEAAVHAPALRVSGIAAAGAAARLAALRAPADVCVCTYQGWMALICKGRGGDEKGWKIDRGKAAALERLFNLCVADESTYWRNHRVRTATRSGSLIWSCMRRLMRVCPYRYPMTGTPFGKDPAHLWTQLYWVDGGHTLGESIGLFRAALFNAKNNYWGGTDYTFDLRKRGLLRRFVRHCSIRYRDTECLDLPPRSYTVSRQVCPAETWAYYLRLAEAIRAARGDYRAVAENAWHRLRQMTAGFMRIKDPAGNVIEVNFSERAKADAAVAWVANLPEDRKAVLFCEYVKSGELLSAALKREGIPHSRLWGGARDKAGAVAAFRDRPACRVLVSSSSGAYGHNLQCANYVGFFESPTDPIVREQMERRCYRDGQTRPVFIVDFAIKGSIDERILRALAGGRDLFKEIIEGRAALLADIV